MKKTRRRSASCLADYYPDDPELDRFVLWLEAPGDDLGMFLGDAPTIAERLATYKAKKEKKQMATSDDNDKGGEKPSPEPATTRPRKSFTPKKAKATKRGRVTSLPPPRPRNKMRRPRR